MTEGEARLLKPGMVVIANKTEPCTDPSYTKGKSYVVSCIRDRSIGTVLDNNGSTTNGWAFKFFNHAPFLSKGAK